MSPELRPGSAVILVLVFLAGMLVTGILIQATSRGGVPSLVSLALGFLVGPLAALYVALIRHAPEEKIASALRLTPPRGRQFLLALLCASACVVLAPVGNDLTQRVVASLAQEGSPTDVAELMDSVSSLGAWGKFGVTLSVLGFILLVELLFRGFIQPRLARTIGSWRALAVTLGLFVLAQPGLEGGPSALLMGIPLGVFTVRSTSAWVPIVGHLAYRVTLLVLWTTGGTISLPFERHPRCLPVGILAACVGIALGITVVGFWLGSRDK